MSKSLSRFFDNEAVRDDDDDDELGISCNSDQDEDEEEDEETEEDRRFIVYSDEEGDEKREEQKDEEKEHDNEHPNPYFDPDEPTMMVIEEEEKKEVIAPMLTEELHLLTLPIVKKRKVKIHESEDEKEHPDGAKKVKTICDLVNEGVNQLNGKCPKCARFYNVDTYVCCPGCGIINEILASKLKNKQKDKQQEEKNVLEIDTAQYGIKKNVSSLSMPSGSSSLVKKGFFENTNHINEPIHQDNNNQLAQIDPSQLVLDDCHYFMSVVQQIFLDRFSASYTPRQVEVLLMKLRKYWLLNPKEVEMTQYMNTFDLLSKKFGYTDNPALKVHERINELKIIKNEWENTMSAMIGILIVHRLVKTNGMKDERANDRKRSIKLIENIINQTYEGISSAIKLDAFIKHGNGVMDLLSEYPMLFGEIAIEQDSELQLTPKIRFQRYMRQELAKRNFRKIDNRLYYQIKKNGTYIHAWESRHPDDRLKPYLIDDFIQEISRSDINPVAHIDLQKSNVHQIIESFVADVELSCPRLKTHRRIWSYKSGVWIADLDLYIPYEPNADKYPVDHVRFGDRDDLPVDLYSCKYIDADFKDGGLDVYGSHYTIKHITDKKNGSIIDIYHDRKGKIIWKSNDPIKYPKKPLPRPFDIPTRIVEEIMDYQDWNERTKETNYMAMGRLMFEVGVEFGGDNLAFVPVLYGLAGTGKTTIAKHACNIYEKEDIAELESKGEEAFMLEGCIDKKIWRIMELKGELRLSPGRYQIMAEGGRMPIPRKNKSATLTIDWTLQGIIVGNNHLPFVDAQGSVARRTLTFRFLKYVKHVKTDLDKELLQEQPNYMRKCYLIYKDFLSFTGNRGIWSEGILDPYFTITNRALRVSTNVVAKYIAENYEISPYNRDFLVPLDIFKADMDKKFPKLSEDTKNNGNIIACLNVENCIMFFPSTLVKTPEKANSSTPPWKEQLDVHQDKIDSILYYDAVYYKEQLIIQGLRPLNLTPQQEQNPPKIIWKDPNYQLPPQAIDPLLLESNNDEDEDENDDDEKMVDEITENTNTLSIQPKQVSEVKIQEESKPIPTQESYDNMIKKLSNHNEEKNVETVEESEEEEEFIQGENSANENENEEDEEEEDESMSARAA